MGADGSPGARSHPWRLSAAQVFVEDLDAPVLSDADSHHLSRVLRLTDGEAVCASDGRGGWRMCTFTGGALTPLEEGGKLDRPNPELCVALAAPKGDRTEWAVRKLTEVGIDRIVVMETARSVVRWKGDRAGRQLDKMRRWSLESSRQCRRLWLPVLEVASIAEMEGGVLADAGGRRVSADDHMILVGPEGGWVNEEREGRDIVALGENVMRTETAAVVAGAAMANSRLWRDSGTSASIVTQSD